MKFWIDGASGFVGRNLVSCLLQQGDSVVALSRSEAADKIIQDAAKSVGGDVAIVRGSMTSEVAELASGMAGCDAVVHAAAKVEGSGAWQPFLEVTVRGTERVLQAARRAGVSRFVHIGTEAVLVQDGRPVHLADEMVQIKIPKFYAPYTKSKILAERAVLSANDPANGFTTIVVRPRFVWGEGDTVNLPEIIEAVDSGSWRFFSPKFRSSTTHVQNLAVGTRLAALKGRGGEAYFLTDGEYLVFEDMLRSLIKSQGRKVPNVHRIPFKLAWAAAALLESVPFLHWAERDGVMLARQTLALIAKEITIVDHKAVRELGYAPVVTVQKGLQEMRDAHAAEVAAEGSSSKGT